MKDTMRMRALFVSAALLFLPMNNFAAVLTGSDSTQPRGTPASPNNPGTIVDGFYAPAQSAGNIAPNEGDDFYKDWSGSMMANAARDPAFFAAMNSANHDIIRYFKSLPDADFAQLLLDLKLDKDLLRTANGTLKCISDACRSANDPEDLLPVTADLCLRCHAPVGWLEAHSEPATASSPFLKGQFWGANLLEEPTGDGDPSFNINHESEAEMEGVQCNFCHRATDVSKRLSRHDGSVMASGNGGFIVAPNTPFDPSQGQDAIPKPNVFQTTGNFCGSCHDVTNPLINTKTVVPGTDTTEMKHPIERTYTEWYWSDYRNTTTCQDCHEPMKFLGAQTWMLYPAMDQLWGDVDQKWIDRGIQNVPASRADALATAAARNSDFMGENAARVEIVDTVKSVTAGTSAINVNVKITNLTGHKLPTGFAEGRQMWIHIQAFDDDENLVYEDGVLDSNGCLHRTASTKVYEQLIEAVGYPFLDAEVKEPSPCDIYHDPSKAEGAEFHFILMNKIVKDNRIPPKGFNKKAYQDDGAFIIPAHLYDNGEYWDTTAYRIPVPATGSKKLHVTATVYYQTFSREYIEFLKHNDTEKTQEHGGRARNLPAKFSADNPTIQTWGETLYKLWQDADMGPPSSLGSAEFTVRIN